MPDEVYQQNYVEKHMVTIDPKLGKSSRPYINKRHSDNVCFPCRPENLTTIQPLIMEFPAPAAAPAF